jgi:CheY-like chemotaxis protein
MKPIQIYLADDDYDDRSLFIEALEDIPIPTVVTDFENGVDLMADLISETSLPSAIFLDLRMPLMDGFECLADIRNIPKFSHIKVIIYSTSYDKKEIDQLKEAGANQYIRKPNSFNQLKTVLFKSIKPLQEGNNQTTYNSEFIVLD